MIKVRHLIINLGVNNIDFPCTRFGKYWATGHSTPNPLNIQGNPEVGHFDSNSD
jgi:hypothetical protein